MYRSTQRLPGIALLGGLLLATASATTQATPKMQTGPAAEVTYDGLQRIDDSVMSMAWVKPDLDLSHYTRIMILPAGMTFKEVRKPGLHSSATDFPLSEQQKQLLRDTILDVFVEELGRSKRFKLTDTPGPDVLQVRGAVLDVVSHIPSEPTGRGGFVLKSLGDATLVVELRDSMSEEILARAADRRTASPAFPVKSNSVTNLGEVRTVARSWASQLRRRLDEFTAL